MNEWEWHALEDKAQVEHVTIGGTDVRVGDRVRLRPRRGGDVLDIALASQIAIVESLEQDYEGNNHVCVVLEEDPGRDLGMLRQPGHRFFFSADEIENIDHWIVHPGGRRILEANRSRRLTTPHTVRPSTIGRWRNPCSSMIWAASSADVSGLTD